MRNNSFSNTLCLSICRKSKEYIYNYVDRVRFSEGAFPDYKCPSRGSGWRQNKSVSHLDLATSCHSAASGLNHWSSSSHQSRHQLRHSRSLDYNHIDRCKDALDIAEYYWRLDHDPEVYDEEEEEEEVAIEPEQLKYVSEHHLTQHYRDFKCADENYHHSANSIYQSAPPKHNHQQQQQQQQPTNRQSSSTATLQIQTQANGAIPPQAFDFGSDSCSLRRSRSLAVIREETFSDLQISSSNGSRRSQLIPRARLVNRGYFRERDRLICSNNKHHHHHHTSREKLTNCSVSGSVSGSISAGAGSSAPSIEADEQSNESIAETCDSHQQQLQHYKQQQQQLQQKSHNQQQQQQQQQHLHYHPLYHEAAQQTLTATASTAATAAATNDYYDHLKRLDKLALGLVAEQLHPWHNDKSDLESLNSDYFKNSLHQSHDLKQHLEIDALEQAVNLLAHDKPRIYQSRRQKPNGVDHSHKLTQSAGASGGESCPENSQSSVFPETTTSNSDDQSDSGSLSEQEYDITKIEEIYQKTHIEGDEESYEIISLTTTTRTRFETTEDEGEDGGLLNECDYRQDYNEDEYTEESNLHTTTDTEVEGTLKRSRAVSENLQKIIAYDSVYLSSEESSDSTVVDTDHGDTSLEVTSLRTCIDEVETLLHISIEDSIYEPKAKQHKIEIQTDDIDEPISYIETVNTKIEILEEDSCDDLEPEDIPPIYTQILKVEHTPSTVTQHSAISSTPVGVTSSAASKPKILSVVEKRKHKRYTDSAYSSNVSDSSDKAHGNYSSNESYASANHQRRQVAEPLYIPLKSNLSDNQYHSLPDVYIGQSLKVFESIDAQLRSSYNLDNYRSLDDSSVAVDSHLDDSSDATAAPHEPPTHSLENHHNSRKKREAETVTSEQIYDSIKRFGRAHQKYRQREIKECQQQQQQQQLSEHLREQTNNLDDQSVECDEETNEQFTEQQKEDEIYATLEHNTRTKPEDYHSEKVDETPIFDNPVDDRSAPVSDQYDSFEKSKEAPAITLENFSQQIERRAKEIQQSGRRNKQQQIEFAHRAKFRLENTLASYSDTDETKAYTYQSKPTPFRIVVTDAQNNIIEEDSIDSQDRYPHRTNEVKEEEKENHNFANQQSSNDLLIIKYNNKDRFKDRTSPLNSAHRQSSLKRAPSKPKRQQYPANLSYQHLSSAETKKLVLSPKTKERRVLSNQIYRARPVKVITATDSFRRNKVKQASSKMSRPQILQVIDNKRKSHGNVANIASATAAPTNHIEGNQVENEYLKKVDAVRCYWSKLANDEDVEDHQQQQLQQQQQHPKDIVEGEQVENAPAAIDKPEPAPEGKEQMPKQTNDIENTPALQQQHQHFPEKRQFILGAQSVDANIAKTITMPPATPVHGDIKTVDDYCSFMPSIEIVELDGDKTATIVSAMPQNDTADDTLDASEPQFDHIRYKVLKSQQLLRSNVLARNKKEAQFDGLIQYLQDYSFQELLSNNNVVIVEPVRTKIERPSSSPYINQHYQQQHSAKDKTLSVLNNSPHANTAGIPCVDNVRRNQRKYSTSSSTTGGGSGGGGGGIKRHFFYQPVRVNRELYEEELPNPDTVRNVRKFFEEHIFPTPGQGLLTTAMATTTTTMTETATTTSTTTTMATLTKAKNKNNVNMLAKQTSPKSRRTRKYRYLTIDTSYGHAATTTTPSKHHHHLQQQQQQIKNKNSQQSRKWDTASLSSGVSSGDLSSPCECNEAETTNERDANQSNGPPRCVNNTNGPEDQVHEEQATLQGVHVQDIVKKHNNTSVNQKSTRISGTGIPVRSSSVRPRNAIYGSSTYASMHNKSGKSNVYRNVYEYHALQGHLNHDSDDQAAAADEADDDDDDLFGDVDDDENELCDTYYVSNDVLRKIRECGSSVTYYGGRVVQTSSTNNNNNNSASAAKTFESHYNSGSGNNGPMTNSHANNNAATTMALHHQPSMLSQTQTRARVREIETCSSAACQPANGCLHSSSSNNNRLPQQKKIHLTKSDNKQNNKALSTTTTKASQHQQNAPGAMSQEQQATNNSNCMEGGGITFKLVKSNSCSSRLELAGTDAADIVIVHEDPEEMEVVRKMVHHFETSTSSSHRPDGSDVPLTINNQTTICPDGQKVTEWPHEAGIKTVTVNNHINVGDSSRMRQSTNEAMKPGNEHKEDNDDDDDDNGVQRQYEEPKTFHTEAKDIHLDYNRAGGGGGVGGGSSSGNEGTLSAKVCRNKNVDLAFTLVKQQQPKSPGIKDQEIGKNHKLTNIANPKTSSSTPQNTMAVHEMKCVTYENTLLPTITATATVNDSHKMSTGNLKADEEMPTKKDIMPAQIIVPVEIHRAAEQPPSSTSATPKSVEEKCFLPLSTTSSVTSVIDKSVVKHYVANDKSIYEKRKYDDIEFEEFEIYDPTKEFEKLIEEEEAKRASCCNNTTNDTLPDGQQSTTSTTSSMRTAKSQQTNVSTETETDCYDSLDDKL